MIMNRGMDSLRVNESSSAGHMLSTCRQAVETILGPRHPEIARGDSLGLTQRYPEQEDVVFFEGLRQQMPGRHPVDYIPTGRRANWSPSQ